MRITYARAVALAIAEAMEADPEVFILGEDVSPGGAYGATQGLLDRFGADRVRDTPISESAIIGFALGAALAGMRPVAEIMHMDFSACAMDQIVNQAAKVRYMFGGGLDVPLTIRTGTGGWLAAAAQHSQSLEAWFTHVPGLRVATAGTPADIRSVLRAAISCADPVIVLEPLALYSARGEVPAEPPDVPLGPADVKREGTDVTIVTWGAMVPRALEAAGRLSADGTSAEVIDLLSLWPWDDETVAASVARTGRLVVAHQASRRSGFGAEITATMAERRPGGRAPAVARVGALNVPVPFSPPLEEYVLPHAGRIVDAVRQLS